ncbi:hypothetical protein SUGI_0756030 [Cryptomeria japonica]|uniref:pentatricopeptide repeat-containing protein At1g62350 n=1 Tax=Cryptomeria japonica TaxID=3369 RepID=UPI002414C58F|nr:pentatricopeptide repeat-containing protein At1g62350 [Cryptomeria japonica]GLJ37268.1 hypothetical protein SUGI_0756030 [Cryptomeria japonica]
MASLSVVRAKSKSILLKYAYASISECRRYVVINRGLKCGENILGKPEVLGLEVSQSEECRWFSSSGIGNLSLWRGKKKIMSREGLLVVQELKRLKQDNERIQKFMKSHVSRLLKSDLLSVLAEFQRQDEIFLALKIYNVVRKESWYKPDKPFYRDMLFTLARNKKGEEAMQAWQDMKRENIDLDQHTYGDIVRAFLDNELPSEAMKIYEEMRQSLDPPLELPYRVILKGLLPYPLLRDKVKQDFQELFPDIQINDISEEMFDEY